MKDFKRSLSIGISAKWSHELTPLKDEIKSWANRNIWQIGDLCKKPGRVGYIFSEVIGGGAQSWGPWIDSIYYDVGNQGEIIS